MTDSQPSQATAGLRGAYWDPSRVPAAAKLSVHVLQTQDGQTVSGYLLAQGEEQAVAVLAHPREHIVASYLASEILRQGCAVFLQAPRSVGNDIRLEHEMALYDLAAAMSFLKGMGFDKLIAIGNSGGGPLWAFYNQQALCKSEARLERTPGGRPTKLAKAQLVPPDALVFVSSHLGQGKLLMSCLDPSVSKENDPFETDAALDPFDASNGFSPKGATYTDDFILRYRAGQVRRVERIDAWAREQAAERASARQRLKNGGGKADRIRASFSPIFSVWRTDADVRCWDLRLDPSDRRLGSLWGADPASSNYGGVGFGRVCTPESWLSTWSGLSSRASMELCVPAIEQPTLQIEYTGDASTFPADNDYLFTRIGSSRKHRLRFRGDHHGRRLDAGDEDARPLVGNAIGSWIGDVFPSVRRKKTYD